MVKSFSGKIFLLSLILNSAGIANELQSSSVKCWSLLRVLLGKEKPTLYQIKLDIPPSQIMPGLIPLVQSRGMVENLKSIARNKPVASFLLKELKGAPIEKIDLDNSSLGEILSKNSRYTFIMTDSGIELIKMSNTPAGFFLTKHNILSQLDPVLFAGELWLDGEGVLHISNSSGSYQPSSNLLPKVREVFEKNFNIPIKLEPHGGNH